MIGVDLLRMQLRGSCEQVATHARDSADVWMHRAYPGASLPGFVAWHCARIVDWGVHTVVRQRPEIAVAPAWHDRVRYELGHGAGITDEEADDVARTVGPDDVATYAESLRDAVDAWAATLTEAALDQVPPLRQLNQEHPRYASAEAWAEIEGLEGLPAWQLLARPCIAHIRVHMGELETLGQALRSGHPLAG